MSTMKIDFGPKFDWFDVLEDLNHGKTISKEDRSKLDIKAGQWTTCACGQLCKLLPRTENGNPVPKDTKLMNLGVMFSDYIGAGHWESAIRCLNRIEARSTELLNEMGIPVKLVQHPRHFEKLPKCDTPKKVDIKSFAARLVEHGAGFRRGVKQNV